MLDVTKFFENALELGLSVKAAISLAKKQGYSDENIEFAISELGLAPEKRRTFRTEFSDRIIALLRDNPEADSADAEKVFDSLVESYYTKGKADSKASNTLKHKDYYLSVYYGFGKALLEATK